MPSGTRHGLHSKKRPELPSRRLRMERPTKCKVLECQSESQKGKTLEQEGCISHSRFEYGTQRGSWLLHSLCANAELSNAAYHADFPRKLYIVAQGVPAGNNYYPPTSGTYFPQQPQPNQYPQANAHPQSSFMSSGAVEHPQPIQYHQPSVQPPKSGIVTETAMRLEECLHNLQSMMNNLSTQLFDDVNQHLRVMESMWGENQLPPEVCDLMFQMSIALCQGNRNYAESLLSSISTNHISCCHEWISGPSAIMQAAGSQPIGNKVN